MTQKTGRNDRCPCGSGKKYKQCCIAKEAPKGPKKLTAKWLNTPTPKPIDLMERTYGGAIAAGIQEEKPPVPAS